MYVLFVCFGERGRRWGGGGKASIECEVERAPSHASCVLLVPTDYFNIETPILNMTEVHGDAGNHACMKNRTLS